MYMLDMEAIKKESEWVSADLFLSLISSHIGFWCVFRLFVIFSLSYTVIFGIK